MSYTPGVVTTLPNFLDTFAVMLGDRPGLDGVNIFTGPLADQAQLGLEYILLAAKEVDVAYLYDIGTPMKIVDEAYDVPGQLLGVAIGSGEEAIAAARDRGFALLDEVHRALRVSDTADDSVWDCRLASYKAAQYIFDQSRRCCSIDFKVHVEARFTPAP